MTEENKNKIKDIVDKAVWESAGVGPFLRCKGCGCYQDSKEHWDKDCPHAELLEIVNKAIG